MQQDNFDKNEPSPAKAGLGFHLSGKKEIIFGSEGEIKTCFYFGRANQIYTMQIVYLTVSFSALPARNFGTFIAATLTISPVRGLRA